MTRTGVATGWLLAAAWTWSGPPVREPVEPLTLWELTERWYADRPRRGRHRRRRAVHKPDPCRKSTAG